MSSSFSGYHAYGGRGVNLTTYLLRMNGVSDVAKLFVARYEYSQWPPLTEIMKSESCVCLLNFFHISEQFRISKTQEIDFFISNINSSAPWTLPPGPRHHSPHPPSAGLPALFPYAWMTCSGIICLSEWRGHASVIT